VGQSRLFGRGGDAFWRIVREKLLLGQKESPWEKMRREASIKFRWMTKNPDRNDCFLSLGITLDSERSTKLKEDEK